MPQLAKVFLVALAAGAIHVVYIVVRAACLSNGLECIVLRPSDIAVGVIGFPVVFGIAALYFDPKKRVTSVLSWAAIAFVVVFTLTTIAERMLA